MIPDADAVDDALVVAHWAARKLARCEAVRFRAAVRHSRTGCPRALARRERWDRLIAEYTGFLGAAERELERLGLRASVDDLARQTGAWIGRANRKYLDAERLPAVLMLQFGLACQGGPPDPGLN